MITVYSEQHFLRNARTELYGGELVRPHECAERAEFVLDHNVALSIELESYGKISRQVKGNTLTVGTRFTF